MESISENENMILLSIPATIFLIFGILAVVFFPFAIYITQLLRFYKSRFTDLGYLTFTLPVKTWHIFISSALNLLIWSAIGVAVSSVSLFIMGVIGSYETFIDFYTFWDEIIGLIFMDTTVDNILVLIFYGISAIIYGIIEPLFAVVLGCTVAKKHKVIATIAIMYGMSLVTGLINGIVTVSILVLSMSSAADSSVYTNIQYLLMGLVTLGLSGILYPLSIHMMKNKLNLP
jgi:hypothetical protein